MINRLRAPAYIIQRRTEGTSKRARILARNIRAIESIREALQAARKKLR